MSKKKYQQAIADYETTLELIPQTKFSKLAQVYNNRGVAYFKQNVLASAISDFSHAIALDGNDASFYFNRASVRRKQKQYQDAIVDFNKSIEIDPQQGDAYFGRGFALYQVGKEESGRHDLFEAATYFYNQGNINKFHQILYFLEILNQSMVYSNLS